MVAPDPPGVHEVTQACTVANYEKLLDVIEALGASIEINPWFYDTITQGTFISKVDTVYYRDMLFYNASPADGDQVNYKALMKAGTYSFKLIHTKNSTFGIWKMLIDDVEKAIIDGYNSSVQYNSINITNNIVVSTTGFKTISMKVDGKNESSSNYYLNVSGLVFQKTA